MPSQELFDRAYSQRATVIKLLVVLAGRLGLEYGYGIDDNTDWESDWRKVIYVQLPEGQYSWHISPADWHLFDGIKKFDGVWDGSYRGQTKEHADSIKIG